MSAVIPSGKSSKDLQTQRIFVEQLRRELTVQRVKLSICVNELIQYCEQQGNVDPLVSPKASHDNPFRNSGGKCVLFWNCFILRAVSWVGIHLQEFSFIMEHFLNVKNKEYRSFHHFCLPVDLIFL